MTFEEIRDLREVWTWRYPELEVLLAKVVGFNQHEVFLAAGGECWSCRLEGCFMSRKGATDRAMAQADYDVKYHELGLQAAKTARDTLAASMTSPFFMTDVVTGKDVLAAGRS